MRLSHRCQVTEYIVSHLCNMNFKYCKMTSSNKLLKIVFSISVLLLTIPMFGQHAVIDSTLHKKVQQRTDQIFDSLVKIRRDFHTYPELSDQEKRTSQQITAYLTSLGMEVHTNLGGYGVVGILKTNKKGKRIAWRADIDALSSNLPDVEGLQSRNEGVRHICGHDIHTTIGLGIANVLASLKDNLKGTIYFIFQPSEENLKGAKAMIDDGLFKLIDPDEIYALHIAPMQVGLIATRPELLFAEHKTIKVSYKNSSENQLVIAHTKKLLSGIQNIEPDSEFWDNRNLLDPTIGLGSPKTIYKDYLTVNKKFTIAETDDQISIRTILNSSNRKKMESIIPMLKQDINSSKYAEKLIEVVYSSEYPTVFNNKELTSKTLNKLSDIYGNRHVNHLYGVVPDGRSDDFAYFQKRIPGVYFLLGGSNFEKGIISMPHSANFAVDENCIKFGVNAFSSLIVERLKN